MTAAAFFTIKEEFHQARGTYTMPSDIQHCGNSAWEGIRNLTEKALEQ